MKHFIFSLLFTLAAFCAKAQVIINKSVTPAFGSRSLFSSIDTAFYKPGNSGANCVWDFSSAQNLDSNYLYILEAFQTPYFPSFKGANLAMTTDFQSFDYFCFNDTAYTNLGSLGVENVDRVKKRDSRLLKPQLMLKFPLQMGDRMQQHNLRIHRYIANNRFTNYQRMTSKTHADAYGLLILGNDSFQALRVSDYSVYTDSLVSENRTILSKQITQQYQWFANNIQAPLLSIEKTIVVYNGDSDVHINNTRFVPEAKQTVSEPSPLRLVYQNTFKHYVLSYNSSVAAEFDLYLENINEYTDEKSKTSKRKKPYAHSLLKVGENEWVISEEVLRKLGNNGDIIAITLTGKNTAETYYLLLD